VNFLQICQKTALESGVSGTLSTTAGQIGSLGRIVSWCADAWIELQSLHDDWSWMRSSNILGAGISFVPAYGQFSTPIGTGAGQVGVAWDNFGKWDRESFRCVTAATIQFGAFIHAPTVGQPVTQASSGASATVATVSNGPTPSLALTAISGVFDAVGEVQIQGGPVNVGFPTAVTAVGVDEVPFGDTIEFDTWRDSYMLGAMRSVRTRPVAIAIGPDQSLNVGPPSNGLYLITGDYWSAPTALVNDNDTPTKLPTRWHPLICWRALKKYGFYEAAEDVIGRAQYEWDVMYRELEAARLPTMGFAGALA
jgi:hypothetical protein